MSQQCKVCASPHRHEIDLGIAQGTLTRGAAARQFGFTEVSVRRHAANHLPKMLATLSNRVQALEADQILSQVIGLYERALRALDEAESSFANGDKAKAIPALIREARSTLESMAKVSVALNDQRLNAVEVVENTLEAEIAEALARRRATPGGNTPAPQGSQAPEALAIGSGATVPEEAEADVVDADLVVMQPSA